MVVFFMVNYPTILGLPQEDIDRQLYVGVLGLESRVKALENKPKPTPTQSGTVTITVQYEFDGQTEPVINKGVMLYTGDTIPTPQDDSRLVSRNVTNDEGVAEMTVWDTITHQATEVTDIPFGTYTLFSSDDDIYSYTGTLTVDGDETVTITLTEQ